MAGGRQPHLGGRPPDRLTVGAPVTPSRDAASEDGMSPQDQQDTRGTKGPAGVIDGVKTKSFEYGRASGTSPVWLTVTKWVLIALTVGVLAIVAQKTIEQGAWIGVVIAAFVAMCVVVVYGTRRSVPLKYLLPGLILLVTLQIWPIAYTVATSFTNYGDGHLYSKQESIDFVIANSVREVTNAPRYKLSVAVKDKSDPATAEVFY